MPKKMENSTFQSSVANASGQPTRSVRGSRAKYSQKKERTKNQINKQRLVFFFPPPWKRWWRQELLHSNAERFDGAERDTSGRRNQISSRVDWTMNVQEAVMRAARRQSSFPLSSIGLLKESCGPKKKQSPVVLLKKMSPPQLLMQGGWVSSLKKKYDTENKRKKENSKFAFQRIETGFGCLVRIRIDRHVQHRACEENQTKN